MPLSPRPRRPPRRSFRLRALRIWLPRVKRRSFFLLGGIPRLIAAHQIGEPALRNPLVSLKVALGEILLLILGLARGASSGREGPTVRVGAGLAETLHRLLPMTPVGALTIPGRASYLSGVVRAPITSFIIVSEMTENHALVIPIMICAILATTVSKLLQPHGVHHTLARDVTPVAAAGARAASR